MTWEHKQHSYVLTMPKASELTETYTRGWLERLFSWPWRPWQSTGTRMTAFGMMMQAHQRTRDELERMSSGGLLK